MRFMFNLFFLYNYNFSNLLLNNNTYLNLDFNHITFLTITWIYILFLFLSIDSLKWKFVFICLHNPATSKITKIKFWKVFYSLFPWGDGGGDSDGEEEDDNLWYENLLITTINQLSKRRERIEWLKLLFEVFVNVAKIIFWGTWRVFWWFPIRLMLNILKFTLFLLKKNSFCKKCIRILFIKKNALFLLKLTFKGLWKKTLLFYGELITYNKNWGGVITFSLLFFFICKQYPGLQTLSFFLWFLALFILAQESSIDEYNIYKVRWELKKKENLIQIKRYNLALKECRDLTLDPGHDFNVKMLYLTTLSFDLSLWDYKVVSYDRLFDYHYPFMFFFTGETWKYKRYFNKHETQGGSIKIESVVFTRNPEFLPTTEEQLLFAHSKGLSKTVLDRWCLGEVLPAWQIVMLHQHLIELGKKTWFDTTLSILLLHAELEVFQRRDEIALLKKATCSSELVVFDIQYVPESTTVNKD